MGFEEETLGRLSGLVRHWGVAQPNGHLGQCISAGSLDIAHPRIAKHVELTMRLRGLPRRLGQHSGGIVICKGLLSQVVPLDRVSMPGRTGIHWDKEDCTDLGLIKVDLLGLGMMAVLKENIELIPQHYGEPIDLAQLPEDPEVYRTLQGVGANYGASMLPQSSLAESMGCHGCCVRA